MHLIVLVITCGSGHINMLRQVEVVDRQVEAVDRQVEAVDSNSYQVNVVLR